MAKTDFKTIDEYISTFPEPVQHVLRTVRQALRDAVPEAEEAISYQIPTIKFHGPVFSFAAWQNHYSLYPASETLVTAFPQLSSHKTAKGTISFPYDKPVPVQLIHDMAKYRAAENHEKAAKRKAN